MVPAQPLTALALSGCAAVHKQYILKSQGMWHWEVQTALDGDQIFLASTPQHPLPRVLALAPGVGVGGRPATEVEWRNQVCQGIE
jgi:hypothetical protein